MTNINEKFSGWIASLSNGQTIFEGKALPGQPTAWQQFLTYLNNNAISMTGLRLQKGGITIHALSHKQCDGYYHAHEVTRIVYRDKVIHKQGIGSVIGEMIYITWVDDNGNVWQDVRDLTGEKIHTTLRYEHGRTKNEPGTLRDDPNYGQDAPRI